MSFLDLSNGLVEDNYHLLFCQFDNSRDAEDAIRGRDGYKFDGHRLRVQFLSTLVLFLLLYHKLCL